MSGGEGGEGGGARPVLSLTDLQAIGGGDPVEVPITFTNGSGEEQEGIILVKPLTGGTLLEMRGDIAEADNMRNFGPAALCDALVNPDGTRMLSSREAAVSLMESLPVDVISNILNAATTSPSHVDLVGKSPSPESSA